MKTCMTCHIEANDAEPTCSACGEASWSAASKMGAAKPKAMPMGVITEGEEVPAATPAFTSRRGRGNR